MIFLDIYEETIARVHIAGGVSNDNEPGES
jgi:hypothetical protein